MTYEESLSYLANLGKFGINLGLGRIEKLLGLMGNPERRFKTVHVTGTNGKGSTTAMLSSILKAAGIKTGMYTSPHLSHYTERMMINGVEVSKQNFADSIEYTSQFVSKIMVDGFDHPTEFEILTAAAFHYFASSGVEYAVVEVGLGGLLDSTNVIIPEVSVITNVTVDHLDKCGSSLLDIAHHKAGIIKQGVPVVTGAQGEALAIIEQAAIDKMANLYIYGQQFSAIFNGVTEQGQQVIMRSQELGTIGAFVVNLLGHHQVDNAAVAVMTSMLLAKKERRITLNALKQGLLQVNWPGRFEVVTGEPTIIIDGAHNQDGARALRKNLDEFFGDKEIIFLLGILKDKDVTGIIRELIRPNDKVVVVAPLSERAGEPAEIAQEIVAAHVEIASSIIDGLEQTKLIAGDNSVICVAGSLYLIGAAREIIKNINI